MAVDAASGPISVAEELLATTLANCDQMLSWTGEVDSDGVLTHIYFDSLPKPVSDEPKYTKAEIESLRPCVLIHTMEVSGWRSRRDADTGWFSDGGTLVAIFEANVAESGKTTEEEQLRWFKNQLGAIIRRPASAASEFKGLEELANTTGFLTIKGITLDGPVLNDELDVQGQGEFMLARLSIEWGLI